MKTQFMNVLLLCFALGLGLGCTGHVDDGASSIGSQSESLKGGIPANSGKRVAAAADEEEDLDMDEAIDEDSVSDETVDGASVSEESVDSVSEESVSDESVSEESVSDADEPAAP
jgi:hypothetical protein